jgi:hypothetical protein
MSDKTPEQQNDDFVSAVLFNPTAVLSSTIEWIATNMDPQEVFDRTQLEAWAKMNGWTPPQET